MADKLFYVGLHPTDDPTLATLPFLVAVGAKSADIDVQIGLRPAPCPVLDGTASRNGFLDRQGSGRSSLRRIEREPPDGAIDKRRIEQYTSRVTRSYDSSGWPGRYLKLVKPYMSGDDSWSRPWEVVEP